MRRFNGIYAEDGQFNVVNFIHNIIVVATPCLRTVAGDRARLGPLHPATPQDCKSGGLVMPPLPKATNVLVEDAGPDRLSLGPELKQLGLSALVADQQSENENTSRAVAERFGQRFLRTALICGIVLSMPGWAFAQTAAPPSAAAAAPSAFAERDGSHDFDFLIGDWKAHLRRMVERETGVTTSDPRTGIWVEYDGICNDKKLLDTNANFEQFDVQASRTHLQFRGQALRMYNPVSHQWSIYGLDLDKGELGLPPLIGQFTGKRGEFFDSELRNGHMVQVRYVWTDISPKSAHMEQSFSPDGGKSWAVNWIVDLSR
jgi:hypothetical protein